ncbi:protein NYNRIN-like, partial [Temnothorax curvispinosus]|uniref:RNA-directed DNA polymerase n=1 Tax=Temnothorax curvispinosus TaxID=300111 RepID=A0A6J1QM56_9HYME
CYKLKKKEQSPPVVTAKTASVVSAVEEDVQEMEIATVNEDSGRKLEIPDARIIVTSVNEIPYNRIQLFQEVATTEEIKDKSENILSLLQDVDTNCNESNKQELEFEDNDNDVAYVEPMPLERELEYKQLRDIKLKNIAEKLEVENNEKFTLIDGLVFHKGKDKPRFVIPEVMINNIIRVYHDDKAHCDVNKTFQGIYENYWCPSLRMKVIDYIDNCLTCMKTNASINTREGELQVVDNPKSPCQIWHTNLFGPISESIEGYKHILVIVDAFTRFTWLFPVKSTSTKEVIKHMELLFNTFGNPNILVSDKDIAFASNKFSEVMQIHNVKHRQVAVDATWANSIVERVNRFLKASLERIVEEQQSWSSAIESIQFVINNTVHSSVKASPSKLLFGYEQRSHSDNELVKNLTQLAEIELKVSDEQDIANELAVEMTDKIKDYNKANHDKQYKKLTQYKEGDYVMIRDTAVKSGEDKKLKPCYKGPYMVTKALNNSRYVIQDIPGFNVTSRPYNSILSPDKIKYWIKQPES